MSRLKSFLTDPAKRPQVMIWSGLLMVFAVLFVTVSVVGTSTTWFCMVPCHSVHDDNTLAYNESSHVMVSCIACHEPVNANPAIFLLKKIEVLPDLIPTIMGTAELPLNENHSVAFETSDETCTQCHNLKNRTITASRGIIMNHEVHADNEVNCTLCHNRVAHPEEDITLVLADRKHENWMTMDACFRCHSLEAGAAAPGECAACHTASFDLVPASHDAAGWYEDLGESGGHAAAYSEEASRVAAAQTWASGLKQVKHEEGKLNPGYESAVNTCYTCHQQQFCTNCHGVEMPHPAAFATDHGKVGTENPQVCANCHARTEAEASGTAFCNACHHPAGSPDRSWISQHFDPVRTGGADQCFQCHNPRYCSACHVDGPEAAARVMQEQLNQ